MEKEKETKNYVIIAILPGGIEFPIGAFSSEDDIKEGEKS